MKYKIHRNSMAVRIICAVMAAMAILGFLISMVVISMSKDIFIDTYGRSQEKVFQRIQEDLDQYHQDFMRIADTVDSSWAFRLYFKDSDELEDSRLAFQTVYKMEQDLSHALPANGQNFSTLIVGKNGRSFLNREEAILLDYEEILAAKPAQAAIAQPENVQYTYLDRGFTATTQNASVLIGAKALKYQDSGEVYAVIFFIMKESDLENVYDFFVSDTADFYLLNEENMVVSSNRKAQVGKNMEHTWYQADTENLRRLVKEKGKQLAVLQTQLPYYRMTACGVIDAEKALQQLYDIPRLALICGGISAVMLFGVFWIIRSTTGSLSEMAGKMSHIRSGNFNEYMEVKGTYETRELAVTYNYMLDDIQKYINQLMKIQTEKRKSEINALQMQINPHYIYNTLASIKWLIWQGEEEKSIKTLDAFIQLLKSTISNTDEFITVEQEMENLKNYILINQTRYGDQVTVEFFVANGCEEYLLPKMVLQPFIENAFFHAFPAGKRGKIQVFFGRQNGNLKVEIEDNGVGVSEERLRELTGANKKAEHFSGIGIGNVDERLKLIYGENYGVSIQSREGEGMSITVLLEARKKETGCV